MDKLSVHDKQFAYQRKKFILDSLKIAGGAALLLSTDLVNAAPAGIFQKEYTVQDIMDIILKKIPGAPFKETVDTLKSGTPDQKVTGIITTMFATVDIIHSAIKNKSNFIIAHEPTFYNHTDDKDWVKDNDIVKKKFELLGQHKIAVWRFHDYCHSINPDAVSYGVAKKAGWLSYYHPGKVGMKIPAINLNKLVEHLKKSLQISNVRVIGDMDQVCETVALLPGAPGGQRQVGVVEKEKPDVLIAGELREWETAEYIRDGRMLGSKTALIILGHAVSEEPGMEWLVDWLNPLLPGISITHIASGDPFKWM
jgi:putative NIF3 family GTP cyclohydrolase 1 type 2